MYIVPLPFQKKKNCSWLLNYKRWYHLVISPFRTLRPSSFVTWPLKGANLFLHQISNVLESKHHLHLLAPIIVVLPIENRKICRELSDWVFSHWWIFVIQIGPDTRYWNKMKLTEVFCICTQPQFSLRLKKIRVMGE